IPTAKRNNPTNTNNPTRSSFQDTCLRCAISASLVSQNPVFPACSNQEPLQIRILRIENAALVAFEIHAAIAEDKKTRGHFGRLQSTKSVAAHGDDAIAVGIEPEIGQREGVLQAMGGQNRSDPQGIAQTQNQRDDGLRSDGV